MTKKTLTRTELQKKYNNTMQKIWNTKHIPPSITLEYIYMNQTNPTEATQMLTLEVQRSLIYNHKLQYTNYSDTVEQTITEIQQEIQKNNNKEA